jgi:hypothetical protein
MQANTQTRCYYFQDTPSGQGFAVLVHDEIWSEADLEQRNALTRSLHLQLMGTLDSLPALSRESSPLGGQSPGGLPGWGLLLAYLQQDGWDFATVPNPQLIRVEARGSARILNGLYNQYLTYEFPLHENNA